MSCHRPMFKVFCLYQCISTTWHPPEKYLDKHTNPQLQNTYRIYFLWVYSVYYAPIGLWTCGEFGLSRNRYLSSWFIETAILFSVTTTKEGLTWYQIVDSVLFLILFFAYCSRYFVLCLVPSTFSQDVSHSQKLVGFLMLT